jgi:hypothetical protein
MLMLVSLSGCASVTLTNDNSTKLLSSARVEWLSVNLTTNQAAVFFDYMEKEVLPTIVGLEQKVDELTLNKK